MVKRVYLYKMVRVVPGTGKQSINGHCYGSLNYCSVITHCPHGPTEGRLYFTTYGFWAWLYDFLSQGQVGKI